MYCLFAFSIHIYLKNNKKQILHQTLQRYNNFYKKTYWLNLNTHGCRRFLAQKWELVEICTD